MKWGKYDKDRQALHGAKKHFNLFSCFSQKWFNKVTKLVSQLRLYTYTLWYPMRFINLFKGTVDAIGNCQRPGWVFSLDVSQHNIHKITNLWKLRVLLSCNKIVMEKTRLLHKSVSFQVSKRGFGSSGLNIWVRNYFFLKTTLLQREPFLTMFYTINSSPMLVTK